MELNKNIFSSQSQEPTNSDHITKICTEEIKIEKEIIEAITGGKQESLKPNSGEAIYFGENYVYVSFHNDTEEDCRVWEWHGQVVLYSEETGYTQDYVCGYFFEKMTNDVSNEEHDEERKETEERAGFKLKDFIRGFFWKN